MLEVLDAFDRGEVGAMRVAESVELHAPALEGISRLARDELNRLSALVLKTDYTPDEREFLGLAEPTAARELRAALEKLL